MSASKEHPKVFISYSWSGPEHEQFVMELATSLRTHGVDAVLDKWRLKPGQDKYVFMESMVTDPSVVKVLVLCDRRYQEKANSRAGGVGTESQIISQELYARVQQIKFIPVLCERGEDGEEFLPVFMKGRIYVDLSSDECYGEGLDELLRQIFEQPLYPEPLLGEAPAFLKSEGGGLPLAKELAGALRAIKEAKANREGLEVLFVRSVVAEVNRLYVRPEGKEGYDEEIYQAILRTKGLRDQVSEYADTLAAFSGDEPKALKACFHLLEQLGQQFGSPREDGSCVDGWADLYRFFALEATLMIAAAQLRYERWQSLRSFLKYPYLVRTGHNSPRVTDITEFDSYIVSMDEHRNRRLGANRICLTADILKERCSAEHTPFQELLQADVFLALYGVVHYKASEDSWGSSYWAPRTSVYNSTARSLPLFLKAIDSDIRAGIYTALGVSSASDMATRLEAARPLLEDFRRLSRAQFPSFNFVGVTNLQALIK
ncbi:toll/interleukin-1 receptor domain-containing protein [Accumulibacter sp.]|uniref:toll/interleukin-1 receptor domain-containing protein n=1 Tax=Accumulibacter sp. TaxID=2053492 RepID=UPI0028C4EAEF|nr:toll/interleukin-1 receptor domain-containing protein [Accumulibacter sp.]